MSLDDTLWLVGIVTLAAVIGLLLYRCVWRAFPVFCLYCAWDLFSNAGGFAVLHCFPAGYRTAYFLTTVVDSALEFVVLVELAWSVLRPIRASLPRSALATVAVLIVGAGAAIWPFAGIHELASLAPAMRNLVRAQETASILRVLFFLAIAGCSQLLSIGWRDREVQIATGLGFYSLVSLAVEMLHTHQAMGPQYRQLEQVVSLSYVCSLLYWVFSFAQKEAKRREFTPQMQNLLLAVAGTARTTRVALMDSRAAKLRRPGER